VVLRLVDAAKVEANGRFPRIASKDKRVDWSGTARREVLEPLHVGLLPGVGNRSRVKYGRDRQGGSRLLAVAQVRGSRHSIGLEQGAGREGGSRLPIGVRRTRSRADGGMTGPLG